MILITEKRNSSPISELEIQVHSTTYSGVGKYPAKTDVKSITAIQNVRIICNLFFTTLPLFQKPET